MKEALFKRVASSNFEADFYRDMFPKRIVLPSTNMIKASFDKAIAKKAGSDEKLIYYKNKAIGASITHDEEAFLDALGGLIEALKEDEEKQK